jgi:hypothetical protein
MYEALTLHIQIDLLMDQPLALTKMVNSLKEGIKIPVHWHRELSLSRRVLHILPWDHPASIRNLRSTGVLDKTAGQWSQTYSSGPRSRLLSGGTRVSRRTEAGNAPPEKPPLASDNYGRYPSINLLCYCNVWHQLSWRLNGCCPSSTPQILLAG